MRHLNATIQDSLSPEVLAQLAQSFGLEMQASDYIEGAFIEDEWLESHMGYTTGEHLWDALWRFGIIVDDDLNYYIPDDYDTIVSLVTLDTPP